MSWKLRLVPSCLALSWFKRPDGWSEHTRKFFRWEHHRCLVDWIRVLLTFLSLILIQNNWQKQKSLVNLSTRAKNFGRELECWIYKREFRLLTLGLSETENRFCRRIFLRPKLQTILNFGVFSWKLKLWFSYKPYLVPYFLILWPNQKWDVFFSTAVAQPRLVKLWLRWQDLLGLFSYYLQCKIPLQPIKEESFSIWNNLKRLIIVWW